MEHPEPPAADAAVGLSPRDLYIDLLLRTVCNTIYEDPAMDPWVTPEFNAELRATGRDWPQVAHSMAGRMRLDNTRALTETLLRDNVPGDLIETGVWRGGACILMKGILAAYGDTDRTMHVADSFEGLPEPDAEKYPADAGDDHHLYEQLAVSVETVRANFSRYGLLDERVVFHKGWFRDTLPALAGQQFALVRLDGDMYESTMDGLESLYAGISAGGFLIIDDYGAVEGCKAAVTDFRTANGITEKIHMADWTGAWWRKLA